MASESLVGIHLPAWPGNVGHGFVTAFQQRLGSQVTSVLVVETDAAVRQAVDVTVEQNDGNRPLVELHQVLVRYRVDVQDQGIAHSCKKEVDIVLLLVSVAVSGRYDHVLSGSPQFLLDVAQDHTEKRAV